VIFFPFNFSFLSNVDGFYYDAKGDFNVLLGLLSGFADLHPEGGSFKLFVFSIPIFSTIWTGEEEPEVKKIEEKELEEKPIDKPKKRKRDFRILIKPIKRLFDTSMHIIKVKELDVSLTTGLSDPYVSGLIFGVVYPFIEMMRIYFPLLSFSLTPVFVEERFRSRVCGSISFRIILFVFPLLRFLLSKEYREYRKL
jgi:hypothetical protein